jgi:hypothetical protein
MTLNSQNQSRRGRSIHRFAVLSRLVPERYFNSILGPELIVDGSKVILYAAMIWFLIAY